MSIQPDDPWLAVRNVIAHAIEGIVAIVGALALIVVVGMVLDARGRAKHSEVLDACLKNATNDAGIERCNY